MEYERSWDKPLPNRFEILLMETKMLKSLCDQLRVGTCKFETALAIAAWAEVCRRGENEEDENEL